MNIDRSPLEGYGFCFAGVINNGSGAAGDSEQIHGIRGAARASATWKHDTRIKLAFMDGPAALHERIYAVAIEWLRRSDADLYFDVLEDIQAAHIRISFQQSGSWSMIGTECLEITDLQRPTMNFGSLDLESDEKTLRKVILHEFGHALGLLHEHKHPDKPFEWDEDNVYADLLGPPNNWSRQRVERNLFEPFKKDETVLDGFDRDSIMLYPIPARWTVDGTSFSGNDNLSPGDIELISALYCG